MKKEYCTKYSINDNNELEKEISRLCLIYNTDMSNLPYLIKKDLL